MRFSRYLLLAFAALLFCSSAVQSQTRAGNRLARIDESRFAALPGNVEPRVRASSDLGHVDSSQRIESMTLRFSLTPAQDAALTQLLQDQHNPASSRYRRWLTPAEYGEQFGLSSSDITKISSWLTSQGFTVTEIPVSRTYIAFSGTVGQVEGALHTSMHRLALNGETHFANITDPELPAAVSAVVTGVTGLNDYKLQPRVQPRFTSSTSGSNYIAPGDLYTIYNVKPLLARGANGSGVTIAVMGQTEISLPSVATFRSVSGLSANPPTVKLYGTSPGTVSGDLTEAMLDVEWAGAAAPSASILYVNSTSVIDKSLTGAINDNLAPIITISYGLCESGWGQANLNVYNTLFRQANAQGITIVGPTGDTGATDCDYNGDGTVKSAVSGLAIDFPASSPFVTALGGTMFNEGTGSYWSSTNGANQGSALSYIPEAVWNEFSTTNGLAGGGGGKSKYFSKPGWQQGTGVPNDAARDVPDVALNAASGHDGYLVCYNAYCANGYRDSGGFLAVVGGTSVATPVFAGFLALVEQSVGPRLGNINPTLYALANNALSATVFHDVTTGDNKMPCTVGTTDCPSGTTTIGYSAGPGYDLATGWGSVDANALVTNWAAVTPLPTGGTASTSTTLTLSASSITSGTNVTVNATVAATSSTGTPTGTGQVLIDGAPSGSETAFISGKATFTVATAGLKSGDHTIAVSYSGDSTFAGSIGSATIDVVSATDPDFSLTPLTAAVTTTSGATASPLTITFQSLNGFTGSLNLALTTTASSLAAQYTFSPTTVTLAANGTATTAITLYAYAQSSTSTNGLSRLGNQQATNNRRLLPLAGGATFFACLLCVGLPRRRRWSSVLAVVVSMAALAALGCGSGGSSGGSSSPGTTITKATPGTYSLTFTATSASGSSAITSHHAQITFTVN